MKKLFILLLVTLLSIGSLSAYTLTYKDNAILDKIEDRLIVLIDDQSNKLTAQSVVNYIDRLFERARMTQRTRTILEIIRDDIEYIYYLGEYSGEDEYNYIVDSSNWDDESFEDSQILSEYIISGNTINLLAGEDNKYSRQVWEIFSTLIPISARGDFLKYSVVDDENADSGAYMEQDEQDHTRWNMTINLDSFYDDGALDKTYVYSTLIHEFAHVLTLNKAQVDYDNHDRCYKHLLDEGCLNEDAYLDDFIDIFWPDSKYLEQVRNEEINAYTGNESSFVTDYAATNPGEDIAESFTYFVMQSRPTGSTVADKKILFFYDYTDLNILRKQIRSSLAGLNN